MTGPTVTGPTVTGPTVLEQLDRVVDRGTALRLKRAWPRGTDRMALEYVRPDGSTIAAQWFADPGRVDRVADDTPGARRCAAGVVLHPDGADRRLVDLAALAAEPGAELVVHRPERRGVVRRPGGTFAKIVRPDRVADLVAADRLARGTRAVPTAALIRVDHSTGRLDWAGAPGRSLHDLLGDPDVDVERLTEIGWAIGRAVRSLHEAEVPAGVRRHTVDDEVEAAERWLRAARRYARVPTRARECLEQARRGLAGGAIEPVLVHRDLHDKQLLVDGASIVVLDLDTLALGEAAVDLANLLVHLELRVLQGVGPDRADAVRRAFLEAYRPDRSTSERIEAYAAATRARLAGVYAFRPDECSARTISERRTPTPVDPTVVGR